MERHNMRSRLAASDDMISSLPDELLSRILSLLPTCEAVATSVLSKRWKFAWTGVTSLTFLDHGCATKESITSFAQFVNTVLDRHHCSYLNQFELISKTNERIHRQSSQKVDFNRCFTYAISRPNVGAIRFETPALGHTIPPALFTCATLESLDLRGPFMVQALPSVVSLPKLQAMSLSRLRYESEDYVEKLISSCSVLRTLDIELFRGFYTVSSSSLRTLQVDSGRSQVFIDAPNLDYLYINNSSWEGRDSITIKRLAFSSTVKLVFVEEDYRILNNDYQISYGYKCIVQLVESVSQYVKYLTLNGLVMKALSHSTTPLSASFPCLTRLDISSRFWDWNSLCVSAMLVKSIKLQALNVELFRSDVNKSAKFSRKCWEDPKQVPECLSSSLEQISFSGFRGFKDEMAMLKYVLNHGAVLKSVNIFSPDSSKYQMQLEQVSMFPRLCPSCQLYLSHDT